MFAFLEASIMYHYVKIRDRRAMKFTVATWIHKKSFAVTSAVTKSSLFMKKITGTKMK